MANKPVSPELTPQEIEEIERMLDNAQVFQLLDATQKAIVTILDYSSALKGHRSNIRHRPSIKTKGSVIEKINDHRRKGKKRCRYWRWRYRK